MIFTVYRLEMFKLLRRPATWVTYLCFLLLTTLLLSAQRYGAPQANAHAFPQALPAVLTGDALLAPTFGVVIIVLMICSEFDWKTGRQNIIDGLSKRQWFAGKVLLIPTVAIALYLTRLAVGTALALITGSHAPSHPFDPTVSYLLAGSGVLLGTLCYSSVVLLVCMTVRSAGPALGVALVYQVFDNLAASILRSHRLGEIAAWLPLQIQSALAAYIRYQPHGPGAPTPFSVGQTEGLFLGAAAWALVLLFASYRIYMRRDL
jgi:ABC-2 type transport system permease protein